MFLRFFTTISGKNLREQVAWTILAEIVIARSQGRGQLKPQKPFSSVSDHCKCGSYCTMRELAQMYPIALAQIKEDMKSKGYDHNIPNWDLCEINDQVHRLQSIFRIKAQITFPRNSSNKSRSDL